MKRKIAIYLVGLVAWFSPLGSFLAWMEAVETGNYWWLVPALLVALLFWAAVDLYAWLKRGSA